ncbi:hypothetical protein [Bradyrhizobium sp. S3.9.1]|uniref:hypothetical protein n=1 Tax=Bradyrhizobium sp. S3.9.1 TaxID=3156431 RepID=UPI003395C612
MGGRAALQFNRVADKFKSVTLTDLTPSEGTTHTVLAKTKASAPITLQKRVDAQRAANKKLADRIRTEGGAAVAVLLKLVHDVAAAEAVDEELNGALGRGAEQIIGADILARAGSSKPREVISETEIALWVFAENGNLIGDQDRVIELSAERGSLQGAHHSIAAVRRKFRQTEYFPAERAEHADPLLKALRLPLMDRPGYAWDSRNAMTPAEALQALATGGAERQLTTELVPLAPYAPEYRR